MESNGGRFRQQRFIVKFDPPNKNTDPSAEIELSEEEIFNCPSGNIIITPTQNPIPRPKPTSQTGLLAALSENRPIFSHKISPIPTRLNQERQTPPFGQSAPISVPITMRRNGKEFDDVEEDMVLMPPHELVARRESPMFSNSVLEGVGRTLKGRDLRKVRNAVWRKTGFLD